jgi:hypothetical protein
VFRVTNMSMTRLGGMSLHLETDVLDWVDGANNALAQDNIFGECLYTKSYSADCATSTHRMHTAQALLAYMSCLYQVSVSSACSHDNNSPPAEHTYTYTCVLHTYTCIPARTRGYTKPTRQVGRSVQRDGLHPKLGRGGAVRARRALS